MAKLDVEGIDSVYSIYIENVLDSYPGPMGM